MNKYDKRHVIAEALAALLRGFDRRGRRLVV
jgi:hypothetical protein